MNATPRSIDFFFDFSSPYSYIASEWIEALAARHGRTVAWHAILLGATFAVTEIKSPVSYPREQTPGRSQDCSPPRAADDAWRRPGGALKREYSLLDFERSARFAGVPLKVPAKFPIATQNAARIFWWLNASDPPRARDWARHGLRALFARGVDLSDPPALQSLAAEFGLDAMRAQDVWNDPRWKAALKAANDAAIALGVFGAPFFIIDGEPFWGNDRRAQIERWLEKGPF